MNRQEMAQVFGRKVRVRVMGVLEEEEKILMLKHRGMNIADELWLPPGGGVEFGEQMTESLKREFREETGLIIEVGDFLCVSEFLSDIFHAYEFFFSVKRVGGKLTLGFDPELKSKQVIDSYEFLTVEEIQNKGKGLYHRVFENITSSSVLKEKRGVFLK